MRALYISIGLLGLACCGTTELRGEVTTTSATFDRWMYPFNGTPGARTFGSTFGAVGNPSFDDLDAQLLVGFATHAQLPAAVVNSPEFEIVSATVRLTTATDRTFVLDNTADPPSTYLDAASDNDPGRPMLLFGVGTRHGFTGPAVGALSAGPPLFEEAESFGTPGPPAAQARHAFASDDPAGSGRDVSNFVRDGLSVVPWAVGDSDNVAAGEEVPLNTTLDFALDLTQPAVVSYLRFGLAAGETFFSVASLHTATAGSNVGIPTFHLGDLSQNSLGQRATFEVSYRMVPEPSSLATFLVALTSWSVVCHRGRQRCVGREA